MTSQPASSSKKSRLIAHSQLPLQIDDSFQKTDLKEQSLHNNKDSDEEHPRLTAHLSIDKRQQDKPHQHSVAEQGMNNPAMPPRTQEQQVNNFRAQSDIDPRTREQQLQDLERTKSDLREREGQLNNLQIQYKTNLATKDQQIYSLQEQAHTKLTAKDQELRDLTNRVRSDIDQKNREVDDIRQMWK